MANPYVPVAAPRNGKPLTIRMSELIVRDEYGDPIAQGWAVVETDNSTGKNIVVMSPDMVAEIFGNSTVQAMYDRQQKQNLISDEIVGDEAALGRLIQKAMNEEVNIPGLNDLIGDSVVVRNLTEISLGEELPDESDIDELLALDGCEIVDAPKKKVKRSAEQWCEMYSVDVVDPDGWREAGVIWEEPITLDDFYHRTIQSTARCEDWDRLLDDVRKDSRDNKS